MESTDFELNKMELSIGYIFVMLQRMLHTVGSIGVQPMVFNNREQFDNEAAGQTLPSN